MGCWCYAAKATRCSTPAHQTRRIRRVARMSATGSPSISTRSARRPGSITPLSCKPKNWAGSTVAARSASTVERPASMSNSSSSCRLSPWRGEKGMPGPALASVPREDRHTGAVQFRDAAASRLVARPSSRYTFGLRSGRSGEPAGDALHHRQRRNADALLREYASRCGLGEPAVEGDMRDHVDPSLQRHVEGSRGYGMCDGELAVVV